jgi:MFS transporter, DHA1 family, multidrug resistance protein
MEFIAMMAMLFASVALSIDGMLPALPDIAQALTPGAPNLAQLVVTSFVLGLGLGTLITGPLSDAIGRKPVLIGCGVVYAVGACLSFLAPSLTLLLTARVLMGFGGSGPRAVGMALVRDLYKGRAMAQVISFVMTVFTLVPAVAPLIGQGVIWIAGWRAVFLLFMAFQATIMLWLGLRQVETLAPDRRRPLAMAPLTQAGRVFLANRVAVASTLAQVLSSASLFSLLSSVQPIFAETFDRAASFPVWFVLIAIGGALGSFLNTRVVMRFGMRRVIRATYASMLVLSLLVLTAFALGATGTLAFGLFVVWCVALLCVIGLTLGNLSALAMEDMGAMAGFASSLMAAFSTVGAVVLAVPVGQAFDGTALPVLIGVTVFLGVALTLTRWMKKPA